MKGLINLFVRRPVTVIMILAAIIIAAVFSLFTLPINRLPEFSVPRVTVETLYPGMAASEIRNMVTIPLEDGLSSVKGLERMRSVSRDNRSIICLDFRWGIDPMAASVLVREAVDMIYPGLPEGVNKPTVTSGDTGNEAHAIIAVSSHNGNAEFARKLAEYEIQARLRRIDGVGSVVLAGGIVNEQRLSLDVPRLNALGIAPSDFVNLLMRETADIPAGNACEGNMELVVTGSGKPDSVYSLSQIILPAGSGSLKVEDAGELIYSAARRESIFVYNGKEAAALEIYRRPGSDPLRLSKDIKKMLNEASSFFSRDVQIELVTDSSSSLISGVKGLIVSAALGVLAIVTVLLIFIRRFKYSMLAALSIPVSIAAGICVLAVTGKSLNSMSFAGLAMGIGLVSDISVIVLDLLHRAFTNSETKPRPEEIGNKASSIAGSSIASTVTTALVFLPIVMLPGPLGSLFGDIAVALVTSVAAGWLYAQFCLPSLFYLFYKSPITVKNINLPEKKSVFTDGSFEKKYAYFLSVLLRQPGKIFAVASILSLFGFISLFIQPLVFINPDESEEVWVSVISPSGTLLEIAENIGIRASSLLSELPSVKTVYGKAGAEEGDVSRRADIDYKKEELILRCVLEKNVKPEKALVEINSALLQRMELPFSVYLPKDRAEVLLGLSAQRTFVIKGKDREELQSHLKIAQEVFDTSSVSVNLRPLGLRPELRVYPNREAAAYLSIPAVQIAETLYVLNEGVVTTKLEIDGKPLDVRVTGSNFPGSKETYIDPIRRLEQIPLKTGQGKTVYLGSLGRIERKEAEASLARLDRADVIYADIAAEKEVLFTKRNLAARFSWFTGADESLFSRYRNSLLIYITLVLLLLYMTMGAQFESFLLPLILMMCIPFSLAGAGPALLIICSKIDSGAVLGLTALFGLVVNNSLILFEISEEKIYSGQPPAKAVFNGACERLQAILITMITTIAALLPLVFSPLGNSQKSMAAAMLGGLTVSTLLSMFAIPPVLIRYFNWKLRCEFTDKAEK
ncbi:MAG: efflux RND transporter permease subunit [Treponema sp.]|nr:efflux RND transporter permease subunit [Treponema sp.]